MTDESRTHTPTLTCSHQRTIQMQMQMELQGYDMNQLDAESQQQLMMMNGMDPMMMGYGMEEDAGGDQWLPPDAGFLQQQMLGQAGGQHQHWGAGVNFAEDDGYEYDYGEDDFEVSPAQRQKQQEQHKKLGLEIPAFGAKRSTPPSPGAAAAAGSKQGSPTKEADEGDTENKEVRVPAANPIPDESGAVAHMVSSSSEDEPVSDVEIGGEEESDADF